MKQECSGFPSVNQYLFRCSFGECVVDTYLKFEIVYASKYDFILRLFPSHGYLKSSTLAGLLEKWRNMLPTEVVRILIVPGRKVQFPSFVAMRPFSDGGHDIELNQRVIVKRRGDRNGNFFDFPTVIGWYDCDSCCRCWWITTTWLQ